MALRLARALGHLTRTVQGLAVPPASVRTLAALPTVRVARVQPAVHVRKPVIYSRPAPFSDMTISESPSLDLGMVCSPGIKAVNEDRVVSFHLYNDVHLVAVFDGHGGSSVADYLSTNIARVVFRHFRESRGAGYAHILTKSLSQMEKHLTNNQDQYMKTGSTATLALISPRRITIAYLGDTRAYAIEGHNSIHQLTTDHTPENADERERIRSYGGKITWKTKPRVNGILAVTRSMGFFSLRPAGVIATPEIVEYTPNESHPTTLLILSDGVHEFVPDQTLLQTVQENPSNLVSCERLVEFAGQHDSRDNMSAVAVTVPPNTFQTHLSSLDFQHPLV
eukprot:m.467941 g.467941  ORF g.467941 m.467941 type:complete len:337 (+) comp57069_c0_seq2:321-1331(+)